MRKKIIVALALLSLALTGAAFAAVENIKVSGDINTEFVTRNLTLGAVTTGDGLAGKENADQFIFTQVRVRFDADLTEGVSAVVRILNERIWGGDVSSGYGDNEANNGDTDMTLDLAYLEMKEFLYQPLTVIVGRQNLRYGNALIIGDPDTNRNASASKVPVEMRDLTLRKSFDAVRGILDYAPWTIDLIFAKIEENDVNLNDDVTVFGANASYDWSSYNGITEIYYYNVNRAPGLSATLPGAIASESQVNVVGGRTQADLTDKLTLGVEAAWQFGDFYNATTLVSRHLNAYAAQALAEYRFLNDYNTKVGLNYTYLSGDKNPTAGADSDAYNAWDPLFEDQSPAEIINIYFRNTNMQYWKASASCMPKEDITVGLDYVYARLAQDNTTAALSVTNSSASNLTHTINISTSGEREIGHELDMYGVYDYTEDVQLKLVGAWFFPGNMFEDTNDRIAYSVRGGVNVNF